MPSNRSAPPTWPPTPWTGESKLHNQLPENGDPIKKCVELVTQYDDHLFKTWNEEIQNLLIFAGLFSGVVTAFALEAGKDLKQDPGEAATFILSQLAVHLMANSTSGSPLQLPQGALSPFSISPQNLRYNLFIYISLILGLSTALVGILCLQWLREFQHRDHLSNDQRLQLRQIKFEGLRKWHVPKIIATLPLMLQGALICFFVGLVDWLNARDSRMAIGVGIVMAISAGFLVMTTVMPACYSVYRCFFSKSESAAECPYKSPQSWIVFKIMTLPINVVNGLSGSPPKNGGSGYNFLKSLTKARNWSRFDKVWQKHQDIEIDLPMAWIAKTFSDSLDSIYAILNFARNTEKAQTAWNFHARLSGGPKLNGTIPAKADIALARDIACHSLVNHYTTGNNVNEEVKSDVDVLKYSIEVYIRIKNSMAAGAKPPSHYNEQILPPATTRWKYDSVLQVPQDLQLQFLQTLLKSLMTDGGQHGHEIEAFWDTLAHFLHDYDNQRAGGTAGLIQTLNQLFIPFKSWVDAKPANRAAFASNLVYKPIYAASAYGARSQQIAKLFESTSFKACMQTIVQSGETSRFDHPFRDPNWKSFIEKNNLDRSYLPPPDLYPINPTFGGRIAQ